MEIAILDQIGQVKVQNESWAGSGSDCYSIVQMNDNLFLSLINPGQLVQISVKDSKMSLVKKVGLKRGIYDLTVFNGQLIGRHRPPEPRLYIFTPSTLSMTSIDVPFKVYMLATNSTSLFIGGPEKVLVMNSEFRGVKTFDLDINVYYMKATLSMIGCSGGDHSRIINLDAGLIKKVENRTLVGINESLVTFRGSGKQESILFIYSLSKGMKLIKEIDCQSGVYDIHFLDQIMLVGTSKCLQVYSINEFQLMKSFDGVVLQISSEGRIVTRNNFTITIYTSNLTKPSEPTILVSNQTNVSKSKGFSLFKKKNPSYASSSSPAETDPAIVQQLQQRIKELEDKVAGQDRLVSKSKLDLKQKESNVIELANSIQEIDKQVRELTLQLKEKEAEGAVQKSQLENFKKQWDNHQSSKVDVLNHHCPRILHPNQVSMTMSILGVGGVGLVVEGLLEGEKVAVKQVSNPKEMGEKQRMEYRCESGLMAAVDHPYVIPLLGVVPVEGSELFSLVLPLKQFNLKSFYMSGKKDLRTKLDIMTKVAHGMVYLHRHGIIHRDLKPQNILVDENGDPQISDFGLARISAGTVDSENSAGTMYYMPPECFKEGTISKAGDVYAFGVILSEILLEKIPFNTNIPAMAFPTVMVQGNAQFEMPDEPKEVRSLIEKCVQKDRSKRPSFEEIEEVLIQIK